MSILESLYAACRADAGASASAMLATLGSAIPCGIDAAVNEFALSPDDFEGTAKFPRCVPPWPVTWFYWRQPRRWAAQGQTYDLPRDDCAALAITSRRGDGWAIDLTFFSGRGGSLARTRVDVGADGFVAGKTFLLDPSPSLVSDPLARMMLPEAMSMGYIKPVLFACSLANCRNIRLVEVTTPRSDRRRLRRLGAPTWVHRTLVIDRMGRRGGSISASGSGGGTALHEVRSHFKTFTADAPLFGKHVGTYWWSTHAAGRVEAGVVEKDFVLGGAS